jgi:hypothetical protein
MEQCVEIVAPKLDWCSGHEDYGFGMFTKEVHRFMGIGLRVAKMVRLINNDQIKVRWRVKVDKAYTFLGTSFFPKY